jgi:diguanylate cyclase (GGDEF)-like protein
MQQKDRAARPKLAGLDSERLRNKLLVVYFLMFILPTAYLLFAIWETGRAAEAAQVPFSATRLGLVVGLPAVVAMSVAALFLLQHSLRRVQRVSSLVESFLRNLETADVQAPASRDEAQKAEYYVSRVIEEFRRHVSAIDHYAEELQAANVQLTSLALADPVTGLYNLKHAMHVLDVEMQRAVRHEMPLVLLLADMDDFRAFNERHGQARGDEALRGTGRVLSAGVRRLDLVARAENDRFIILLLETTRQDGIRAAERLRQAVAGHAVAGAGGGGGERAALTASMGLAAFAGGAESAADLVRRAEEQLLLAKRSGKNRVSHQA